MKAVTVKAVVGVKEVLETCMNLIYPSQRIVLIGQQFDLIRVVCLAGEAEFLDQNTVGIILVMYQRRSWRNGILKWLERLSLGWPPSSLENAQDSVISAGDADAHLVGGNAAQLGSLRRPLDVLRADGK